MENISLTEIEMQKIMADEKLIELAKSDPKRAKRVLANRQSALRSKVRRLKHISELEQTVKMMESQEASLSSELKVLQYENHKLTKHISGLKLRIQAMQQHDQLYAMQEALDKRRQQFMHATW